MHIIPEEICQRKLVYARDMLVKKYNAPKRLGELQKSGKDNPDNTANTLSGLERMLATYEIVREHVLSMTVGPYESAFSQMYATHAACDILISSIMQATKGRINTKVQGMIGSREMNFNSFHPQLINQIMTCYLESLNGSANASQTTTEYFSELKSQVQTKLKSQKYIALNQTMQEAPFEVFGVQFSGASRSNNRKDQITLSWADIGGYEDIKAEFQKMSQRLNRIDEYSRYLHLEDIVPGNIILVGPPGTGKTLLARTFCETAGIDYKILVGSDIRSTYVNGSVLSLAAEFEYAKTILTNTSAKAYAIFIDEFDEIATKRHNGEGNEDNKLVTELCQIMDGVKTTAGLFIIGATNHYDAIDWAIQSKFGITLKVDLPDAYCRSEVFRRQMETRTAGTLITVSDVNNHQLAAATERYSCRAIKTVVKHALIRKADEVINSGAIPSITTKDLMYEVQNGNHTI